MEDNDYIQRLSANIDFFADKADAHASIFIAFVFGLFALLTITDDLWKIELGLVARVLISIVFWAVFLAGGYSYINFCLYSQWAHNLRSRPEIKIEPETPPTLEPFYRVKRRLNRTRNKVLLFGIIYYLIAFIPRWLIIRTFSAFAWDIVISAILAAILYVNAIRPLV